MTQIFNKKKAMIKFPSLTLTYGKFDGTYAQDYEFHPALGNLDECNGGDLNGKYVYFATDEFPFFHRCHWGKVSKDFLRP